MNNSSGALFEKAYQLQQENHLKEAIAAYNELLEKSPDHVEGLHFLGLAYAQLGDMNTAIRYFSKALDLEPTANLENNLANAYKNTGDLDEAIKHYQVALQLNPHYAQAHNNLATVYALKDNIQKALHHYSLAVKNQPDSVPFHYNLGLLLLQLNKLDAAETQFKNVLALNPNHIDAHFYLGVLYLNADRLNEAEEAFKMVLSMDESHVEALTNLGVIALKKDQGQIAVDYFTKALAYDNDHLDARNNLAATFMHYDRFENALMHYDVLLEADPNNIEYRYNSGVAQMALGHLQDALIHFETILSKEPNHFATLNNMAAIYMRLDDREQAITYLNRALTIKPDDSATRYMLNALTGGEEKPPASLEYVSNLFNNYALYYDQHMKDTLKYALPEHIAKVLHALPVLAVERTVDLGCGTGLSGIVLKELTRHLTGVDVSAKMLALAKEKDVYDELIESDLVSFLIETDNRFDLAVAADVLPYLGDLVPLFNSLKACLSPDGLFVFSCEISKDKPWQLQKTARFSHSPEYIQSLCEKYDFELIKQEQITGRRQNDEDLSVMLYFAKVV